MDCNSTIGLILIAVLVLLYFNYFAPAPPAEVPPSVTQLSADSVSAAVMKADTIRSTPVQQESVYQGVEELTKVETNDLILTFSNRGGILKEVELKKFKSYYQKPLKLVTPSSNHFALLGTLEGKDQDFYSLFYKAETHQVSGSDSTAITFTVSLADGKTLTHTYTIPSNGYKFNYSISSTGLEQSLNGDRLTLAWVDAIPNQEKDIKDSRTKTTVNYYDANGDFDNISEASTDLETEAIAKPISWVSIKQKFFSSAILAKNPFSGGEVSTSANINDTSVVKTAQVKVFIPKADVISGKAQYSYYFGPNDYKILTKVTDGFSRNLSLGWPPVIWVNKFVIIPIFHFLETYISNYGIIIIILVILVRLLLTPLTYTSYLGMAKMRLLKPELDLIKEKNGDNMTQTQQDQMKLYQQAGVNPFSGCIPLLLQMPILFAMFYFFPISVELRQKSFLWAEDLSTYDSVLNLPFSIPFYGDHVSLFVLLMTASTLVYTWQNNQMTSVTGPMKSMSYIMPVIFMFVLNSFSAGLSFYYFVSNLVGFAQQAIIKRFVDEDKIKSVMEDHKKKMVTGTGKKSKFMSKLEEAMKASEEARKASEEARKKGK